ncbi:MAG: hypothetical protein F6K19_27320 [Cyanothece sp. SIO1E1]|nr:hypothetical protein [Cyanothece sp. SIO1E1]
MKFFKQITAGLLLLFGGSLSIMALMQARDSRHVPEHREEALAAFWVLTFPATVAGSWLAWSMHRQGQKAECDRLQATFFRLLQAGNGTITTLSFAMAAKLNGRAARHYLDEKAKEFNATFKVSEEGGIAYYFAMNYLQDAFEENSN